MKNFKYIVWKLHPATKKGIIGELKFDSGVALSIVAGPHFYSSKIGDPAPHHSKFASFEVAVIDKNGEWATKGYFPDHNDDVVGWQSREDIDELISRIEECETK